MILFHLRTYHFNSDFIKDGVCDEVATRSDVDAHVGTILFLKSKPKENQWAWNIYPINNQLAEDRTMSISLKLLDMIKLIWLQNLKINSFFL